MRRWIAVILAAAAMLCAAGCVANGRRAPEGKILAVYYETPQKSPGGDVLAAASVPWNEEMALSAEEQVRAAMELLLGRCREEGFITPLPVGTRLLDCSVTGSVAMVNLSEEYGRLSGMKLTIADYCVTLTLTQIKPVSMVRILADGEEISEHRSSTLLAGDALLTSTEDVVRTFAATLYFRSGDDTLVGEERLLTLYEGESRGMVIWNALLAKPENKDAETLLPQGFSALSFRTESGVCVMNLPSSDEALLPEDVESQALWIQSVVKSLCSLDDVDAVQILVDGEMRGALGGVDISQPLSYENGEGEDTDMVETDIEE